VQQKTAFPFDKPSTPQPNTKKLDARANSSLLTGGLGVFS